jgi:predicted RNase H-like HicB family nuclease
MVRKKSLEKDVLRYVALFDPQKEGGFTVTVPALPGCISEGDTFEEATKNIKEAIELYLETVSDRKLELDYIPGDIFVAPVEVYISK